MQDAWSLLLCRCEEWWLGGTDRVHSAPHIYTSLAEWHSRFRSSTCSTSTSWASSSTTSPAATRCAQPRRAAPFATPSSLVVCTLFQQHHVARILPDLIRLQKSLQENLREFPRNPRGRANARGVQPLKRLSPQIASASARRSATGSLPRRWQSFRNGVAAGSSSRRWRRTSTTCERS